VTYDVWFFLHLVSRKVHVAGMTWHADQRWMTQIAHNVTMVDWGFFEPGQNLIHDCGDTYRQGVQRIVEAAGITCVPLPPRLPQMNADAEHWVRSVKAAALSRRILFGEHWLRHALQQYETRDHQERPHQRVHTKGKAMSTHAQCSSPPGA